MRGALTTIAVTTLLLSAPGVARTMQGAQQTVDLEGSARPQLRNARVRTLDATAGLERRVDALLSESSEPAWIAYAVPLVDEGRGSSCCWTDRGVRVSGCNLESKHGGYTGYMDETISAHGERQSLVVLLRIARGRVGRVRSYTSDCPLDAGGLDVYLIENAEVRQSVRLLTSLLDEPRQRETDHILGAIAMHDDPEVDRLLERRLTGGFDDDMREAAAFWLGEARGPAGFEALKRAVAKETDRDLLQSIVFALSLVEGRAADEELVRIARKHPDAGVRSEGLFWLAERAGERAAGVIGEAIDDDPEVEVKKQAVFALSQLPAQKSVPALIEVARTHRLHEIRQEAMFWLGQSNDPRVVDFFEAVLFD